ncbi:hypothetical protein [Microbacterium sp. MPKO10]|nr:hypothetical protein [Microbacterium sp. MPKO10]MCW4457426.1 hypothetical protein [Microbacterium sp. MPKO10]
MTRLMIAGASLAGVAVLAAAGAVAAFAADRLLEALADGEGS